MSTVTIGLKRPNSIWLEVGDQRHLINGANSSEIFGGHGITEDVPQELWGAWLAEYKNHDLVTGGFIFAHESKKEVKAEAKDNEDNLTKSEQLDPNDEKNGVEKADF